MPIAASNLTDAEDQKFAVSRLGSMAAADVELQNGDRAGEEVSYERAYLPVNRKLDGTMHSW